MRAIDPGKNSGFAIQPSSIGVRPVEAFSKPATDREIFTLIEAASSSDTYCRCPDLLHPRVATSPSLALPAQLSNYFSLNERSSWRWLIEIKDESVPDKSGDTRS